MKCPRCGREIEDGSLFCKYCFADIRIVPTYDEKVEASLQETLQDMKKDVDLAAGAAAREEKKKEEARQKKRRRRRIARIILLLGCSAFAVWLGIYIHNQNTPSYFVGRAYDLAEKGQYTEAADEIQKALQIRSDDTLLLLKAEYLQEAGRREEAIATARLVISRSDSSGEDVIDAYGRLISIYEEDNDYLTISRMLEDSGNEEVQAAYSQYMVFAPRVNLESGTYQDSIALTLSAEGGGSIFYTLDGSVPTRERGQLYSAPISLDNGEFTLRAISINRFGLASDIEEWHYTVGNVQDEEDTQE